jgi:redox-sensitive bicupin YhaK (pirin superfamily)
MITIRKSEDRGHVTGSWLDSYFSFSFASYHDPRHMGVSALRVINQDVIKPFTGFGLHPHDNMEILTYVLRGAVSHTDSMGNKARIAAGELQLMSAGTGITHSEYNREAGELELLQIWLFPNVENATPRYQQELFADSQGLRLVVSPDGAGGSLQIRQDARIYRGRLADAEAASHELTGNAGYVQLIKGQLSLNGQLLQAGDGAEIQATRALEMQALQDSEFLLFDLP